MSVIVVGAGPVGLVAAIELARRDVEVRVLDRLDAPTTESRAAVVHARTLEALARIGVVDEVIATGQRTVAMTMYAGGEELIRFALDTVHSPYPFSVSTPQDETERILRARLTELGVSVERGRAVTAIEQGDGVRATLDDGSELTADFLIGADGAGSTVRHLIGEHLEGKFEGERFLMGDIEADHGLEPTSMHTFFSDDSGPLLAFPFVGRRIRLIAQIDDEREPTLENLQTLVNERTPGFTLENPRWLTRFETKHAQVSRYRTGRVFLAGDAAHVHSPAGGQGMNTGIQDAFNLGWKLAHEDPSEHLLDSYHDERHPVAARVIKFTQAMTVAGTVHNPLLRRLRNRAIKIASGLGPITHSLAEQNEETHVSYRDSPIVSGVHRKALQPGDIAPAAPLSADHVTVENPDGIMVVRPDGYIGLLAAPGDDVAVEAYFARLTTRNAPRMNG